jgi:hypothetical protein
MATVSRLRVQVDTMSNHLLLGKMSCEGHHFLGNIDAVRLAVRSDGLGEGDQTMSSAKAGD